MSFSILNEVLSDIANSSGKNIDKDRKPFHTKYLIKLQITKSSD